MQPQKSDSFPELNERQREVLFLTCKGLRNVEIARQLGVAERTVKGYLTHLFVLFDVTNRTELVGRLGQCLPPP